MNWRDLGIIGVVLISSGLIVAQVIRPVEPEDPYAHQGPRSPNTQEYVADGPSFTEVRDLVAAKAEHYRELFRNGDLESFAPDGETADPEYSQAFLALLIDIENGMGYRSYRTGGEEAVGLIETRQKVLELERRFLAGETLGAIVFLEKADHSVVVLEGTYAGRSPKFSPDRREIRLWDVGVEERALRGTGAAAVPDPVYTDTRVELEKKHEYYLDPRWETFAPDGETVDPIYNQAFRSLLVDLMLELNLLADADAPARTAGALEIKEEAAELERRFLVGEDLGSEVEFTLPDGTEHYSVGTYAGRSDGSASGRP